MTTIKKENENESGPFIHIIMINGIAMLQIYFVLNLFTDVFNLLPDFSMDTITSANYLFAANLLGLISSIFYSKKKSVAEVLKFRTQNSFFRSIIIITRNSAILSGALAVVSTIALYFSGFDDILIFKGMFVLISVGILSFTLFLIYIFYYKR